MQKARVFEGALSMENANEVVGGFGLELQLDKHWLLHLYFMMIGGEDLFGHKRWTLVVVYLNLHNLGSHELSVPAVLE